MMIKHMRRTSKDVLMKSNGIASRYSVHRSGRTHAGAREVERRVTELGAALFRHVEHAEHEVGVLCGDVMVLLDVAAHIVELRFEHGLLQIFAGPAVHAGLVAAKRTV